MARFTEITGVAAALLRPNINTDLLAPGRRPNRDALAEGGGLQEDLAENLFAGWRYDAQGNELPEFVLNQEPYRRARILLGGANFGCGSSREMAVWALMKFGIHCVIAPSFGTIFQANAFKNGLLPVTLPIEAVRRLAAKQDIEGRRELTVSLVTQEITSGDGEVTPFHIAQFRRQALLEDLDDIQQTLRLQAQISAFQDRDRALRPWIYP
jgi:3-isopropylmalate/(R)-2-methylmalate dehydratase small subunit